MGSSSDALALEVVSAEGGAVGSALSVSMTSAPSSTEGVKFIEAASTMLFTINSISGKSWKIVVVP